MARNTRTGIAAPATAQKKKTPAKAAMAKVTKAAAKNADDLGRVLANFVAYAPKSLLE